MEYIDDFLVRHKVDDIENESFIFNMNKKVIKINLFGNNSEIEIIKI